MRSENASPSPLVAMRRSSADGSVPSALEDLLARVEAADGPDRDLDLSIGLDVAGWHVGTDDFSEREWLFAGDLQCPWPAHPGSGYDSFTESLDLALALYERVLPVGVGVNLYIRAKGTSAGVWTDEDTEVRSIGKTPALAVLAGLLKALIAQAASPR